MRGVSQTALGARAGIPKGEMSNIMRRPRPSAAKLGAIASAWNVRLEWLTSGMGPVEDLAVANDRYPNRALAATIALQGGIGEAAVRAVVEEALDLAEDPPVLWWIHRIERNNMLLTLQPPPGRRAGT